MSITAPDWVAQPAVDRGVHVEALGGREHGCVDRARVQLDLRGRPRRIERGQAMAWSLAFMWSITAACSW